MSVIYKETSEQDIEELLEQLYNSLENREIDHRTALKIKLFLEALLLELLEQNYKFEVKTIKSITGISVEVIYEGEAYNPFDDIHEKIFLQHMRKAIEFKVRYNCRSNRNTLNCHYTIPFKIKFSLLMILGFLATMLGVGMRMFIPSEVDYILAQYIEPIFSLLTQVLKWIAIPLIFFSQIESLAKGESFENIKKIAKVFFARSSICIVATSVSVTILLSLLLGKFEINTATALSGGTLTDVKSVDMSSMIVALINSGIIPAIIIGSIIGIVLNFMGDKGRRVTNKVKVCNEWCYTILKLFCKIMPVLIAVSILIIILSASVYSIYQNISILVCTHILTFVLCIIVTLISVKKTGNSIGFLSQAAITPGKIAFLTASSLAARGEVYDCAYEKFKINRYVTDFTLNIGGVLYCPASIASCTVFVIFMMDSISVEQLPIIIFAIIITTLATPSVPGGGIITATILFSTLQLDVAICMPIYIAVELISDYIVTGGNVYCLVLEMLNIDTILKNRN